MRSKRYLIYSLIITFLEEVALAIAVLWLLPRFGINIPLWALILMLVALGAYFSKSAARRLVKQGGAYLNDIRLDDLHRVVTAEDLQEDGILIRAGKKKHALLRFAP